MKKLIASLSLIIFSVVSAHVILTSYAANWNNNKAVADIQETSNELLSTQETLFDKIKKLERTQYHQASVVQEVLSDSTKQVEPTTSTEYVLAPSEATTANQMSEALQVSGEKETVIIKETITQNTITDTGVHPVDLANDVKGMLAIAMGGTGRSSFPNHGLVIGDISSGLGSLLPGEEDYVLTSQGTSADPEWMPLPEQSNDFDSITVGSTDAFMIASDGSINQTYSGNNHAMQLVNESTSATSSALILVGNNTASGTMRIIHQRAVGQDDTSATAMQIALQGGGTSADGIVVDAEDGTNGKLLRLQNKSVDAFSVDSSGNVEVRGSITQGSYGANTSYLKYGTNTGDQFFIGTTGAFRIQRASSNSEAFRVQINGDTQGRWRGTSDGSLQWGDGSNPQDVFLKRGGAGTLQLTGGILINNANDTYNTVIKGANDSNLFFVNAATNAIGIGISNPKAPFHIHKNGQGFAAMIVNQTGSGPALSASVSGQTKFVIDSNGARSYGSLCVKAGNSSCVGTNPGTIYANNTTVQAADVAENYISSETLEPGDIVMPASDGNNRAIKKTTSPYQPQAIGIVSTEPGITLNSAAKTDKEHPYLYPIALQGRVYLKVTGENGSINPGDVLTTSSLPGVAMKATTSGPIVAKALDSYDSDDPSQVNKIMVFVSVSSYVSQETTRPKNKRSGVITLPEGQTETILETPSVSDEAHLFIQAEGVPLATAYTKESSESFIIRIGSPQSTPVQLHWWIIE